MLISKLILSIWMKNTEIDIKMSIFFKKEKTPIDNFDEEIIDEKKISITEEIVEKDKIAKKPRKIELSKEEKEPSVIFENLKLLQKSTIEEKPIACGIHNDKYYIALSGDKYSTIIVTSDKKIYSDLNKKDGEKQIRHNFWLSYKYSFEHKIIKKRWSNPSVAAWLQKEIDVDIIDLFNTIKKIFLTYIYHPDERVINYMVTDIICTYFMPIFEAKGRTIFYAPSGSGKSKLLKVFSILCFNGIVTEKDTSTAALYRYIRSTSGTIIKDNLDRDDDSVKEILNLIDIGYKKGTTSLKCTGQNFSLETYDTYSHLVMANISGISDKVAISRCNMIELVKTKDATLTKREINENDEFWQNTKDKLYIYTMSNWKTIQTTYDTLDIKEFSGRDMEKLKANLTIAKLVDENIVKGIIEYFIEKQEQDKIIDLSNNWLFLGAELINKKLKYSVHNPLKLSVKEITEELYQEGKVQMNDKLQFSQFLGKIFTNHNNFFKKCYKGKNIAYWFEREKFQKFIELQDLREYLELKEENSNVSNVSDVDTIDMTDLN